MRGQPLDNRGGGDGNRFLMVSDLDHLATTTSLGDPGVSGVPGGEEGLGLSTGIARGRPGDVSFLTGAKGIPMMSVLNLEDQERSPGVGVQSMG